MPIRTALLSAAGCLALSGCGGAADSPAVVSAPTLPTAADPPKDAPAPQPVPGSPASQPAPKPVPLAPLPNDLAGKAVQKAIMPGSPGAPGLPAVKAPRGRTTDLDRGELPMPRVAVAPVPSPSPKGKPPLPSPPTEKPPFGLGEAASLPVGAFPLPERPLLKANSPLNPGATDVPAMARQLTDRAPVDDPTVELSAKGVIQTPFPLPPMQLPFLREVIPNPFEFAEQLKGKLGKEIELGTAPAVVNPEKK